LRPSSFTAGSFFRQHLLAPGRHGIRLRQHRQSTQEPCCTRPMTGAASALRAPRPGLDGALAPLPGRPGGLGRYLASSPPSRQTRPYSPLTGRAMNETTLQKTHRKIRDAAGLCGGRHRGELRGLQQPGRPVNITSIPTVGLWNPSKNKACPEEQRRGKNWNGSRTDGMLELQ
jgi:hypothetical protein